MIAAESYSQLYLLPMLSCSIVAAKPDNETPRSGS